MKLVSLRKKKLKINLILNNFKFFITLHGNQIRFSDYKRQSFDFQEITLLVKENDILLE